MIETGAEGGLHAGGQVRDQCEPEGHHGPPVRRVDAAAEPALEPYGSGKDEDPTFDKSKYLAIGESDRMTLKFVKK